jgi:nucleotide-binding universal stress UspA family protein
VQHIVVGVDGTESSSGALAWAVGAAGATGAELLLVAAGEDPLDELRHRLEQIWSEPAVTAGCAYRVMAVEGDARAVLAERARAENADLIVVGSGNAGWFPALHLGSVSHHLAQHTDRPVCIVPPGVGFDASRIAIGLDGSPGSGAAAHWVASVAPSLGSTVTAVNAWERTVSRIHRDRATTTPEDAERDAAAWASVIVDAKVPTDLVVTEDGDPARALARAVEESKATMVVIGTRGTGGFHGLRLGSVALKLLQHSSIPIVLVPPPA